MKSLLLISLANVHLKGKKQKQTKNVDSFFYRFLYNSFIALFLFFYSIVEFAVRDDMEYALKKLNDRELNGQRVTLREVTVYIF